MRKFWPYCRSFAAEITQTPPAFCAVKINGRRAYELARKGEEVNIPERQITVYELEFTAACPAAAAASKSAVPKALTCAASAATSPAGWALSATSPPAPNPFGNF